MKRRRMVILAVAVGLLVVVAAGVIWVRARSGPDSRLAAAMALAPSTAVRFSWTDWTAVRSALHVSSADADQNMGGFLNKAFDADLSSQSALVDSARTMDDKYGVSPANLSWELYSQGTDGALLQMGLPSSVDLGDLRDTLERLGYHKPASDDGVWTTPGDDLTAIGDITPELANLTIDSSDHVLAASDSAAFLSTWRDHQRGPAKGDDSIDQVVATVGDARTAAVYDGDFACQSLAMNQADESDQATGARLITEAGEINPLDAFAMAYEPSGDVRVAMAFESADQARTNADSRSKLAVGPAPGQGGTFQDRFKLGPVTADNDVVSMTLHPRPDNYVLSDLSTGPLLFASC
ncbi:MAG: hypothetical protein FWE71_06780 [Nocardioidaceae bacterium]|nr:hypothetical protein [Nocardioidaceae bacterium]MCL2613497.1 hypothetical protein [Nocardioidaceae bacterium]